MAQSEIEWTDLVWNPTTGCNKVSAGCKNCYAEGMHKRLTGMDKMQHKYNRPFLDGAFEHPESLLIPMRYKKGKNIFVTSMSDLFHDKITFGYQAKVYAVMFLTPQHTYQNLTKRADIRKTVLNMSKFPTWVYNAACELDPSGHLKESLTLEQFKENHWPLKNVWEGTSVENQEQDHRVTDLLETPAHTRWLSVEPMVGPVDLNMIEDSYRIDWIVVGGESGHKRRPFTLQWAYDIKEWCWTNDVPFFMKQIDKVIPIPEDLMIREYPRKFQTEPLIIIDTPGGEI